MRGFIPGPPGNPGGDGSPGASGLNAYCLIPLTSTQPAIGATIDVRPSPSTAGAWAVVGQIAFLFAGGYYEVMTPNVVGQITLKNLGYAGNAAPGASVGGGYLGPAGLLGPTGAAGAMGAASPFDAVQFCEGAAVARVPTLLTETTPGAAQLYGIGVVATIPGVKSAGLKFRATIASGSHSFNCSLYEFDGGAAKHTTVQAHSAGTATHTVSWAEYTMDVGCVYWHTLFCTTANKRNSLAYSADGCRGPDVPTSQVPPIWVANNVLLLRQRFINTETAPISGSGSDLGTGVLLPITPIIVQP